MTEDELITKTEQRLKEINKEINLHKKAIQGLKGQRLALNSIVFSIQQRLLNTK